MTYANLELRIDSSTSVRYAINQNTKRVYGVVPAFLELLMSEGQEVSQLELDTWLQETADELFSPDGYSRGRVQPKVAGQDPSHEVVIDMQRRWILYTCTTDRLLPVEFLADEQNARNFITSIKPLKDTYGYTSVQIPTLIE